MATREDRIGMIGGEGEREDPRGPRAQYRAYLMRSVGRVSPEDMAGAPSMLDRLAGEFGRGMADELTLGHGSDAPIVGGLLPRGLDREALRSQALDPNTAPEGAGVLESLKHIDATDVAAGVGRLVGMAPWVVSTGGLANVGARLLGRGALKAGAPRAAKFFEFVSARAPEEASTMLRMAQKGSRNLFEGLAFSTSTEPFRNIEEGQSRARSIALNTGVGAAADFLLGAALPFGAAPLRTLSKRLRASDNSVDREIADQIDDRIAGRVEGIPPTSLLDEPGQVSGEARQGVTGDLAAGEGRGIEPEPVATTRAEALGIIPPERQLTARATDAPLITPAPEGSVVPAARVDRIGRDRFPPRVSDPAERADRLASPEEPPITPAPEPEGAATARAVAAEARRFMGGRDAFSGNLEMAGGKPQMVEDLGGGRSIWEHGGKYSVVEQRGRQADIIVSGAESHEAARAEAGVEAEAPAAPTAREEALAAPEAETPAAREGALEVPARSIPEEDYQSLSRTGRQFADVIEEATDRREVVAQAANLQASGLKNDDKFILEGLILRRLDELEGGPGKAGAAAARPAEQPGPRVDEPPAELPRAFTEKFEDGLTDVGRRLEIHRGTRERMLAKIRSPESTEIQREQARAALSKLDAEIDELTRRERFLARSLDRIRTQEAEVDEVGLPVEEPAGRAPGEAGPSATPARAEADLSVRSEAQRAQRGETVEPGERIAGPEGREAPVKPADAGEPIPARYRVVEADALEPSHNPETFQRNPRYPEGVQERPYDSDQVLQEHTAANAQRLDPDQVLDATVGNTTGPPVVRPDGTVLGGNGRTMMLQRAAGRHPERFAEYRAELERRAEEFGLDPEQVRGMENPVLVRETEAGTTRDQLREIGERLNVDPQKGRDPLADAASRAARLERGSSALSHLEGTIAPDQTLRDYLGSSDGRRFMERLIEDGVIDHQKASEFIDADGFATPAGREMVEGTLLVAAVGDARVVGRAMDDAKSVVNALVHATPAILRARSVEGFNIHVALQDALELFVESRRKGLKLNDLLDQGSLFAARDDNPYAVALARFIDGHSPSRVKAAFREFATDAVRKAEGVGEDIFGDQVSFGTTFERVFGDLEVPETLARELGNGVGRVADVDLPSGRLSEPGPEPKELRTIGLTDDDARAVLRALRDAGEETAATSKGLTKIGRRTFQRGTNWMRSLGENGRKLADDIDQIDNRAAKREAQDLAGLEEALRGLSRAQREQVAKLGSGLMTEGVADPALVERAEAIRKILDRIMPEANSVGLRRLVAGERVEIGGSGKWMPQVPNREGQRVLEAAKERGLADPAVRQWAEEMVKDGLAVDLEDARRRIVGYRNRVLAGQEASTLHQQLRGLNPYLESTRFELPERYRDWDLAHILPRVVERNWLTVEAARQWGPQLESAGKLIRQTELESEPGVARVIQDFVSHRLGVGGIVMRSDARLASHLSSYETIMRLGFSVLSTVRQIGQRVTNTADLPLAVQFRALKDFPPILNRFLPSAKRIRKAIEGTGAVRARTPLTQIERGGGVSERLARGSLELSGFMAGERGNQYTTALMARYGLEHDLKQLMRLQDMGRVRQALEGLVRLTLPTGGGLEGAVVRRLNRSGMSDEAIAKAMMEGGTITPDQFELAMHRANKDRNFALTFATERVWWGNSPWLRLAAKFKPFVLDQTGLIWNNVVKEAVKGHTAPLVKFLGWTFLMGEIYNIARDSVTGNEESFTFSNLRDPSANDSAGEVGLRVLKNIGDGGGLGLLQDILWGVSDFIAGPFYGSTMTNLGEAAIHSIQRPAQTGLALVRFVGRESSVLKQAGPMRQRIDRLQDENNRYFEVRRWRGRAFDFRRDREAEGLGALAQRTATEAITGRFRRFTPTPNTLSYGYTADAITAGDVDEAGEYLSRVLSGLDAEELEGAVSAIRSSMAARSPLGPIAEADRVEFLRSFPASQRSEALSLNGKWRRDYIGALQAAVREASPPEGADPRARRDFEMMQRRLEVRLRRASREEGGRERQIQRELSRIPLRR